MTSEKDPHGEPQRIAPTDEPAAESTATPIENSGETEPEADGSAPDAFPIVGIGASAGGLAAFEEWVNRRVERQRTA
jgi:chemotaxis response regulator CheB